MNANQKEKLVLELYEKYPYPAREAVSREKIIYFPQWVAKIFGKTNEYWKNKKILELGCGTGELANALALCGAKVKAIDFSSSSIMHAKKLSKKLGTERNAEFIQKNIFKLKENEFGEKFDAVIALGSLHHTINAKKAFTIACTNAKPGGLVIIGLYNKYSRFRHRIKRFFLWLFCRANIEKRIEFGEKFFGSNQNKAWAADKYGQVHESYHSINEILQWFKEENISFIASKPKFKKPFFDEIKWLFEKKEAFFVMVGKK